MQISDKAPWLASQFLGINIQMENEGLHLHQALYVTDIFLKSNMANSKSTSPTKAPDIEENFQRFF